MTLSVSMGTLGTTGISVSYGEFITLWKRRQAAETTGYGAHGFSEGFSRPPLISFKTT